VPAGFTITTEACVAYMKGERGFPVGLQEQIDGALERLERRAGRRLGDRRDPLLVSVRSGARESMPGMLDTVLNLGLNDASVIGLAAVTGNERFAWDSYRRLVQMFANVVRGVSGERLQAVISELKADRGVRLDTELGIEELRWLVERFKGLIGEATGEPFPQDPLAQLRAAVCAVFDSWLGERAVQYRRINRIPDDWGTAVSVQQMVFGNKGDSSGSGVAFSRDEITGSPEPSGDFLTNAQGEDVVSGTRNTQHLAELAELMPDAHAELIEILRALERHYCDMQDTEFTIEEGQLYMLQTRNAKRPAQAALRFACDAVDEGLLSEAEALATLDAASLDALLHPTFDPSALSLYPEEHEQARAQCRWVAIRDGRSAGGSDDAHRVVALVAEDDSKARVHNDRPRPQRAWRELERRHGLRSWRPASEAPEAVGSSRGERAADARRLRDHGDRGEHPQRGSRQTPERIVRACATVSRDESEFVRRRREQGVRIRPRYATGGMDVVVGCSVRLAGADAGRDRMVW
jgi:phosphoenolpyruvate synthase/pyruvate phosphate dikinase